MKTPRKEQGIEKTLIVLNLIQVPEVLNGKELEQLIDQIKRKKEVQCDCSALETYKISFSLYYQDTNHIQILYRALIQLKISTLKN